MGENGFRLLCRKTRVVGDITGQNKQNGPPELNTDFKKGCDYL